MKILLIKTHAIGDVLMITPAIRAIRKKYPKSYISMLVGEWSKEVVEGSPYIDRIITFKDNDLLNFNLFNMARNRRVYSLIKNLKHERFNIIIMFHRAPSIHLLGCLIGARERIGISELKILPFLTHKVMSTKNSDLYAAIDYMEVAHAIGADGDFSLDISITQKEREYANSLLFTLTLTGDRKEQLIGICPGGTVNPAESVPARRWSVKRYAELCNLLNKMGFKIVILGAISDIPIAHKLMIMNQYSCIDMCGKSNLKQLAALIERCKIIVTNDSAPLHIAVAVGTPSIALFGPTIGKARMPLNSKHIAIQSKLGCSPCYNNRRFSGCRSPRCMEYISVEEVRDAILKLL